MDNQKEIEAKFYLRHLADIRQRAIALGGRLNAPRELERNLRFDSIDGDLTSNHQVLRLRQDIRSVMTYKKSLSAEERTEIEIEVDNIEAAKDLLEALGYQVVFIYEKYRQTFALDSVLLMLDELPFGCFVEVEGPTLDVVKETANKLELDWEKRSKSDYMTLFDTLRHQLNLPFRDATFANFADRSPIQPAELGLAYANQLSPPSKEIL